MPDQSLPPLLPRPSCPAPQLNDPQAQDSQIEAAVARVVDGLFCMLATLGVVPLIRCPRGGAAEHVAAQVRPGAVAAVACCCTAATAQPLCHPGMRRHGGPPAHPSCLQLDAKLRDALAGRSSLFSEGGAGGAGLAASLQRPLLCLFDRNFELSVVLQHAWTYKPLVSGAGGGPRRHCQRAAASLHVELCAAEKRAGPGAFLFTRPFARQCGPPACLPLPTLMQTPCTSGCPPPPPGARRAGDAAQPHHAAGRGAHAGAAGRRQEKLRGRRW